MLQPIQANDKKARPLQREGVVAALSSYYLVRVHSTQDSMTLAERLIREHRVATIPGSAFADPSPCSIRISHGALSSESIIEGLRRLVGGLRALAG